MSKYIGAAEPVKVHSLTARWVALLEIEVC